MMSKTEERFHEFKNHLLTQTGDVAILFRGLNSVRIKANEFTPERNFRSLQEAIDTFSRYLPVDFVNKL